VPRRPIWGRPDLPNMSNRLGEQLLRAVTLAVVSLASACGARSDSSTPAGTEPPMTTVPVDGILDLSAAAGFCALRDDGTVWCWGPNPSMSLGASENPSDCSEPCLKRPRQIQGLQNAVQISMGVMFGCAVLRDHALWCWGDNRYGQLGQRSDSQTCLFGQPCAAAGPVPSLSDVRTVAAGTDHVCALLGDATVRCWGSNDLGQLGDGTRTARETPAPVAGLAGAVNVACGPGLSCAMLSDGRVWCWGGGTGLGYDGSPQELKDALTPRKIPIDGVSSMTLSSAACALRSDATVWCWGGGPLRGVWDHRFGVVQIADVQQARSIRAAATLMCAFGDSNATCWGLAEALTLPSGARSRLDVPTNETWFLPTHLPAFDDAKVVIDTAESVCALSGEGVVRCQGSNSRGGLGQP